MVRLHGKMLLRSVAMSTKGLNELNSSRNAHFQIWTAIPSDCFNIVPTKTIPVSTLSSTDVFINIAIIVYEQI